MRNKKRKCFIIAVTLLCATAIISCTNKKGPQEAVPEVSFSKDVLPILVADCAISGSCHSGSANIGDNIDFDSSAAYNSIVNKALIYHSQLNASILYTEISTGLMPKAPYTITSAQANTILDWVTQGAQNN